MTEFLLLPPFDDPTMRPAARELAASDVNPRTTATQMTTIAEPSSGAETRRGWTRWGSEATDSQSGPGHNHVALE